MERLINNDYSDDRFEKMGVELQMDSNSFEAAKRNYELSCMMCCSKGCGAIMCSHCRIREALLVNGRIFRKKLTDDDKEWLEKERELR